jgi:release factor glutamine methyltransferase
MNIRNNNLKQLKDHYISELKNDYGSNESEQLISILIEHLFGITRYYLILNPNTRISESEILKLHMSVKDLKKSKPVQYITGSVEFMGLDFCVTPATLIPRPETEELVQLIIDNEKTENIKVLDVGTGSGCIAISLFSNLLNSEVTACDFSEEALSVAIGNATTNSAIVTFINFNILNYSNDNLYESFGEEFDIIVSNPPYVTDSDKSQMQDNVLKYEPHDALFVPADNPLIFYRAIVDFARIKLKPGGRIYFEINENLGIETLNVLENGDFIKSKLMKDIHGKHRFIKGIKSF